MLEQEISARHLLDDIMVWDVQSHDTEGWRSFRDKMESLWMWHWGLRKAHSIARSLVGNESVLGWSAEGSQAIREKLVTARATRQ